MGLIRTLHAWAGAILALVLVVLGLSGSLLVLREDWVKLTVPQARAAVSPTAAVLGAAAEAVEAEGRPRSMMFAGPHLGVHRLTYPKDGMAYAAADGAILARWTDTERVEQWVFQLHHRLLAGESGEMVVGVSGLAGAVLCLTGVIVWFPAWRSFAGSVWPRSTARRDLVSSHRDLGILMAVPVLILCLTGGMIIFSETSKALLSAVAPGGVEAPRPPLAGEGDIDWPVALAGAQAAFPQATLRLASWPAKPGAPAAIRMKQPAEWHPNGRTLVYIDPSTSRVIGAVDAQAFGPGARLQNVVFPIHAGSVGGRLYDLVVFLGGLALAALGGLGLWSFLVQQRRAWARSR
ncbi:PepSY domain-containing protein [Phenylobacterium sp.]|uniref:PepSY-associated TM helix domain-containing protein n=1 Tax=Phenylobacterium sp. TaxID=1871053 RepID=UPI00271D0759|nr:PepSY-associated TM helix domain-containing protein [Phenylobacterium sp.]MDO8378485.1 PepSY-associated TM helix domain-containing protein [Phenylobacterium sp.]